MARQNKKSVPKNSELKAFAKRTFEDFSYYETGKKLFWEDLSQKRQLAWMEEVLLISEYFSDNLKEKVKPLPPAKPQSTTWGTAYEAGREEERTKLIGLIDELHDKLLQQFEDYKEDYT